MTEFRKKEKREHWGKAYSLFNNCRRGHVPHWNLYLRKLPQSVDNFGIIVVHSLVRNLVRQKESRHVSRSTTQGAPRRQHKREASVTMVLSFFVLLSFTRPAASFKIPEKALHYSHSEPDRVFGRQKER